MLSSMQWEKGIVLWSWFALKKSFAKALVSLWLAHISHRLHWRTMAVGWPCIWLQAITSSTAYLSNRGDEKAKPKLTSKLRFECYDIVSLFFIMMRKLKFLLIRFNVKSSYTKYSRIIGFGWNSPYHISDNIGFLLSICAQLISYTIWHTWFIALWNTVILFHLHEFFCYVSWKLVSTLTLLVENYATKRIL